MNTCGEITIAFVLAFDCKKTDSSKFSFIGESDVVYTSQDTDETITGHTTP